MPRTIRLLQLTDSHLFADPTTELYGVNTSESFQRTLQQAIAESAQPPDAILVSGDIGDDTSESAYLRFRTTLQSAGVPVYCLPGNHDDPGTMARLLDRDGFQCGGRARLGDWGLVMVDSHLPGQTHGMISAAAFAQLDGDLHVLREQPVLLAVHHPPVPVGSPWIDAIGLRNATELLARLERFPNVRVVVSGHVHQAFDAHRGELRLLTTPSTCAQFTPCRLDFMVDTRPPGYRWLHLGPGGRFDTAVKWLEG